jgi:hypothetical protein
VNQLGWDQTGPAGRTHSITVEPGENVLDVDFGNHERAETTNRAPVFNSTAPTDGRVGEHYRYQVSATDPDGDPLSFDLPVRPAGMVIDSATGVLAWRPTANQTGLQDVILRVRDSHGATALQAFQVDVAANTPPIITSIPLGPAVVGRPYESEFRAQDADGDTVVYNVVQAPAGMTVGLVSGLVEWMPTAEQLGVHPIIVTASDNAGGFVTAAVQLEVVASTPNSPPVITSTPRDRIRLGATYVYRVETSDPNLYPKRLPA